MKTKRASVSVRVVSWQDFCIKILRLSSQGFLKLKFSVSSRALRRLCLFASKQETASLKSCIFQYTLDLRIITLSKVCSLCRFASQDPKLMFSSFLLFHKCFPPYVVSKCERILLCRTFVSCKGPFQLELGREKGFFV